ncbi:dTDP-4-dehydrorhamnose reductase [Fodinicurvata sp. EGI_FJ10296]|uniref:dTDP-4-dehydrorhamnose reductase n=1 Tax=Fodinicurvata sp. EGI_FJ10296 TaxID=3231908 RepID=UPI0034515312
MVVGRGGQLSRALSASDPNLVILGRDQIDLEDAAGAEAAIIDTAPDIVVNAAAYTAVDKAESDRARAYRVNAEGAAALARGAAAVGAAFLHVSTDYVFDGTKSGEWTETDPTCPINVYGASKLAGEHGALAVNARTMILRTSWVYSPYGGNFVKAMLRLSDRERLSVVADQHGKPTSALDLAAAILSVAPRLARAGDESVVWGIWHYAGRGTTNWAAFADAVFTRAMGRLIDRRPVISAIATTDYPTPARRPHNSALDCSAFERMFSIDTVPWESGVDRVIDLLEECAT